MIDHAHTDPGLRPAPQEDVFSHSQPRHQAHFLVHGADTLVPGIARAMEGDELAVDMDFATIRRDGSA